MIWKDIITNDNEWIGYECSNCHQILFDINPPNTCPNCNNRTNISESLKMYYLMRSIAMDMLIKSLSYPIMIYWESMVKHDYDIKDLY